MHMHMYVHMYPKWRVASWGCSRSGIHGAKRGYEPEIYWLARGDSEETSSRLLVFKIRPIKNLVVPKMSADNKDSQKNKVGSYSSRRFRFLGRIAIGISFLTWSWDLVPPGALVLRPVGVCPGVCSVACSLRDMTRLCEWRNSFTCGMWLFHVFDYSIHILRFGAAWRFRAETCRRVYRCVRSDSFMCETWFLEVCDVTRLCARLLYSYLEIRCRFALWRWDLSVGFRVYLTWLVYVCHVTRWHVFAHSFISLTWLNMCIYI